MTTPAGTPPNSDSLTSLIGTGLAAIGTRLRIGTIKVVESRQILVEIAGTEEHIVPSIAPMSSASVGDSVVLLEENNQLVALGRLGDYVDAERGYTDSLYVSLDGDTMTGTLETPDLVISGSFPEPGKVWTAEDALGGGAWQEPSALVVAETSDPVLINWFDQSTEGWAQYAGTGTMSFAEMDTPSMPGVIDCVAYYTGTANLLSTEQASMEAGTLAGLGFYGDLQSVTGPAAHGDKFARLTTVAAHGYIECLGGPGPHGTWPVTPGETITIAASVKYPMVSEEAQYWSLYVVWWDAVGAYISEEVIGPYHGDWPSDWLAAQESAVVPAGIAYATPRVHFSGVNPGQQIDFDRMGYWKGAGGTWQMPFVGPAEVWGEWQATSPMIYEPGALYRMTVRARLDAAARLSFGFQGYDPSSPPLVVDASDANTSTNPHWCAVDLAAGDAAWEDDVNKPGQWRAWTGYISEKTSGAATGIPGPNEESTADSSVKAAAGVHQWRPAFRVTGGRAWIDAVEVYRLERSLELPGGITVSDVYTGTVAANSVTTQSLVIPPSEPGHLLTATDEAGRSAWLPMPVAVTEGPPESTNLLTENQATGTDYLGTTVGFYVSGGGATLARDSNEAAEGTGSLKATFTVTTITQISIQPTLAAKTPVVAGLEYTFMASVMSNTAEQWRIGMVWYKADGTTVSTGGGNMTAYRAATLAFVSDTITATAPADAAFAMLNVYRLSGLVGSIFWIDRIRFWEGTGPTEAPTNPQTISLGTLYGKHGGALSSLSATVTIANTTAARVAGSLAVQWTQVVPAMVTIRQNCYVGQSANATANIYVNIGVEDDSTGALLLTDNFAGPNTATLWGGSLFRSATGGITYVPMPAFWRRYLPPGTYLAYPVAYVNAVDAANKTISYVYLDFEIDPNMTYLPGMRP